MLDSWEVDSDEERKKEAKKKAAADRAAAAAADAAANKKTPDERLAQKKAAAALEKANKEAEKAALESETPAERRARMHARELAGDMAHAEDLFGAVDIGAGSGTSGRGKQPVVALVNPKDLSQSVDLTALPVFKPTTKAQFDQLHNVLVPLLTANVKKPHYSLFLQDFARALAKELSSDQIRLVASKLTTLSNEKQREEKEKGSKKKGAATKKVALASAGKETDKLDTKAYDYYD